MRFDMFLLERYAKYAALVLCFMSVNLLHGMQDRKKRLESLIKDFNNNNYKPKIVEETEKPQEVVVPSWQKQDWYVKQQQPGMV